MVELREEAEGEGAGGHPEGECGEGKEVATGAIDSDRN